MTTEIVVTRAASVVFFALSYYATWQHHALLAGVAFAFSWCLAREPISEEF